MDPCNAINPMMLSDNKELIPDAVPVINGERLALLGTENLNTGDKSNSDEDDNNDGEVYEPPVEENRNSLNVFDSFIFHFTPNECVLFLKNNIPR